MSVKSTQLLEYISTHYEVLAGNPAQSNTFLIAEDPLDQSVSKTNGLFISQFASPNSTLVVEGVASLLLSPTPKTHLDELHIENAQNIERIIGWDISNYIQYIDAPNTARMIALHLFSQPTFPTQWKQGMLDFLTKVSCKSLGCVNLDSAIESNSVQISWLEILKLAIVNLGEQLDAFYLEKVKPAEDQHARLVQEINAIKEPSETSLTNINNTIEEFITQDALIRTETLLEKTTRRMKELDQFNQLIIAHADQAQSLIEKKIKLFEEVAEATNSFMQAKYEMEKLIFEFQSLDSIFPARTKSMIETLEKVRTTFNMSVDSYIFLTATIRHLQEKSVEDPQKAQFYSLQLLRTFLQNHPNIVVLKPKDLKQ